MNLHHLSFTVLRVYDYRSILSSTAHYSPQYWCLCSTEFITCKWLLWSAMQSVILPNCAVSSYECRNTAAHTEHDILPSVGLSRVLHGLGQVNKESCCINQRWIRGKRCKRELDKIHETTLQNSLTHKEGSVHREVL